MKYKNRIFSILLTAIMFIGICPAYAADNASGGFSDCFDEKDSFEGWQKNKSECDTVMEITEDGYLHYTCENSGGNNTTVGGVIRPVNGTKGLTFAEGATAALKFRVKKDAGAVLWVNTDVPLTGEKTLTNDGLYGGGNDWRSSLNNIKIYDDKIEVKSGNDPFPYTLYDSYNVDTVGKWIEFTVYYDVAAKKAAWSASVDGQEFSGKSKDWSYFTANINSVTDAKWGTIAFLSYGYDGTSKNGSVYIDEVTLSATKAANMKFEGAEEIDGKAHFYLDTDVRLDSLDSIVLKDSRDNIVPTDISYIDKNTSILDIATKDTLKDDEYKISGLTGLTSGGLILSDAPDIMVYPPESFPITDDFDADLKKWTIEANGYEPKTEIAEGALRLSTVSGGTNENEASVITRQINNKMGLLYKDGQNILIKTRIKKDSANSELSLQLNRNDVTISKDKNAFSLLKICDDKILYRSGSSSNANVMKTLYEGECNEKWIDVSIYLDGYNKKAKYFVSVENTSDLCMASGLLDSPFDDESSLKNLSIKADGSETYAYIDYLDVYKNEELPEEKALLTGYSEKGSVLTLFFANECADGESVRYSIKWLAADSPEGTFTEIENAVGLTHTVADSEDGKVIKAQITPFENGTEGEKFFTNSATKRTAPEAQNVRFDGEMYIGSELTGKYDYYDVNGDKEDKNKTEYVWYRGDLKIPGADKITYTLTEEDIGKYIKFGIRPAADSEPKLADKIYSSESKLGPVKPVIKNVKVKHQGAIYYVAEYEYIHEHNYEQGEFKYTWYADGREISNTNSCTVTGKCNKLELVVVPVSKKAPYEGEPITVTVGVSSSDSKGSTGVSSRGNGNSSGSSIGKTAESVIKDAEKENEQNTKPPASDIDNHWSKEYAQKAVEKKIMSMDENNNFYPDKLVTRAEFIAYIFKIMGYSETEYKNEFSDVSASENYAKMLQTLVDKGIISRDAAFRPNDNISRQEVAKVLSIILELKNNGNELDGYTDVEKIGTWAVEFVKNVIASGIMKGVSQTEFSPKTNITNGQMAKIVVMISEGTYNKPGKTDTAQEEQTQISLGKDTLSVAFIGGSLTQLGEEWRNSVAKKLSEKTGKTILGIDASLGGTGSEYGASRYVRDVLSKNPDIVFIDFAINDEGADETVSKKYMEEMVRMSLEAQNIPAIVFLYAPNPTEIYNNTLEKWENGVKWKNEIAEHYGIKTVNISDYMIKDYENKKKDNKDFELKEYLDALYKSTGDNTYNVHGGYSKYAEAINEAIDSDYEAFLMQPKNVSPILSDENVKYGFLTVNDCEFSGEWDKINTKEKAAYTENDKAIPERFIDFYPNGVMQTSKNDVSFKFKTTAAAVRLSICSSNGGRPADVMVDGKKCGTADTYSIYSAMDYPTQWTELPNDGKEHTVEYVVQDTSADKTVFSVCGVMERFN